MGTAGATAWGTAGDSRATAEGTVRGIAGQGLDYKGYYLMSPTLAQKEDDGKIRAV